MSERERWRNIRRAPGYRVSSLGRVRGPGGPLTPDPDKDGYLRVTLRGEKAKVMHLVLEAFAGPRPYGLEACHDPGRSEGRHDCRAVVLRWDTGGANERDKKRARRAGTEAGTPPSFPRTSPGTAAW